MSYEIKLEVFEGPLDLLLHLIHRNEVSITDIPIALITSQYLETIDLMQSLNLDVAGDYLLMASYLTHIKSQILLPAHLDDDESAEPVPDPREELVAHLLDYKRYKEAAENLASTPMLDRDVFVRDAGDDGPIPLSHQPLSVGLNELLAALRDVIERTSRRDLLEVEPDRLPIKDKINRILERLEGRDWLTFASLFEEDRSRANVVTTFLALLELVKLHLVSIYQDAPFGTILISRWKPREEPVGG